MDEDFEEFMNTITSDVNNFMKVLANNLFDKGKDYTRSEIAKINVYGYQIMQEMITRFILANAKLLSGSSEIIDIDENEELVKAIDKFGDLTCNAIMQFEKEAIIAMVEHNDERE